MKARRIHRTIEAINRKGENCQFVRAGKMYRDTQSGKRVSITTLNRDYTVSHASCI